MEQEEEEGDKEIILTQMRRRLGSEKIEEKEQIAKFKFYFIIFLYKYILYKRTIHSRHNPKCMQMRM